MSDSTGPGERLRYHRRRRGLTQEALAERAGLSTATVKKIERGGSARIETYHALARALGQRTSALFDATAPHTARRTDEDNDRVSLLSLRRAISPPVGLAGRTVATVDDEPDLRQMGQTAKALNAAYHRNEYADVAELLPALIESAHAAVGAFEGDSRYVDTLRLRSDALQQAGRYLTQVRAYDLAHIALRDAMADATRAGDHLAAGAAVSIQGWLLIRQGRLDEAEQTAMATADAIEPRISRASRDELAVWGRVLTKASSAAARNNRPQEAREILKLARTAGAVLGDGGGGEEYKSGRFNGSSVAFQAIENYAVAGRPDRVLALSERVAVTGASTSNTKNRHLLDVVQAHTALRHGAEATEILDELADAAPDWLRLQQLAADAFDEVLRTSKRRLSRKQRRLAVFFDAAA